MKEIPLTKRNRMERMIIAGTLLSSIWDEVKACRAEDIEHDLLQNAVYAQMDINRIVWKLNELNGAFTADTSQLEVTREEFEKIAEQIKNAPLRLERFEDYQEPYCEVTDTPQTDVYDYKGNGKWERSE